MYRETKLVLIALLLVIIPTSILTLLAARNLEVWEVLQESRLEGVGSQAIRAVSEDVRARLIGMHQQWRRDVHAWFAQNGGEAEMLTLASAFRRANEAVSGVVVVRDAAVIYPPPGDEEPGRNSRARWDALSLSPYRAVLDAARNLPLRGPSYRHAVEEHERLLDQTEAPIEIRCAAGLEMAQGYRQIGRSDLAVDPLRKVVGISGGLERRPESPTGPAEEPRDPEGRLYHFLALSELSDAYEQSGARREALDTELQLIEKAALRREAIVSSQREALRQHMDRTLARWRSRRPTDSRAMEKLARGEELRAMLRERESHSLISEPEREALLNRLAECLASGDGLENPSGLTVGEAVYVLGPVDQFTNSYAGFRVDVVGIRRLVAEAARAEAEPRGVSLLAEGPSRNAGSMTGAALQAPMRWLVEEYMPSPFASVKLLAFATPSSELGSSGVLRMQLYVWGVFLLAVGVVIGSWLVVSIAAAEIRHARAGSDFVASVSHELRTPLASMKMLTESLYLGNVTDEQTKKKFLETMLKEYERLWHLIEGVLFVVRTGQGASRYRLREEDLGDLVRSAVDSFVRSLRDETVNITVDMPRHVLYALVDAVAMEQVLLNLLDNAVKYSRASKEIRVTVGPINNGRHIEVAVHDRGIGLEKRDLRKVFRKFYRVQGPQTAEVPGVGLGLALCRHIVKAHRGRIEVESRVGVGSTFRVILPSLKREPHEMP